MSARRTIGYVVLVVLVLGLLATGAYAIYRLGYAQGAQASSFGPMMERFESMRPDRIAPWQRPGQRGGFIPAPFHRANYIPWFGVGVGALGIVALAVTAAVLLIGGRRPAEAEADSKSDPPDESSS